jgi:isocitrate dehydrogenase kinase/phosphatase
MSAVARAIARAFGAYHHEFRGMTRRARGRFARRDWRGARSDAAERLGLYRQRVDRIVAAVDAALEVEGHDAGRWTGVKSVYAGLVATRDDAELAETFFNSVSRRVFGSVGVDPRTEFAEYGEEPVLPEPDPSRLLVYPSDWIDTALVERVLSGFDLGAHWADLDADSEAAAARIVAQHRESGVGPRIEAVEFLPAIFYRNKGAYVVGRVRAAGSLSPLVLALVHEPDGIRVDAVLTSSDDVSVLFGFTRSYFHADVDHPRAAIAFLRSIMPLKRLDELYTTIGYNKHGKTELYRDLLRHLDRRDGRFEHSEGDRGMVMAVFTLASLNVVFKVIKDRFDHPKSTTRERVREKYDLVFAHDRVGRLADAQEFEHLALRRDHFAPELLDELLEVAGGTIRLEGEDVVVGHVYTERRVTPLNLYLRSAPEAPAREAVLDYGTAVKDLAAANIFPGDMLLKNFGVTRHGRVVFYDYDELCLLTECRFRRIPEPASYEEEMSAEPWFHVGEHDVFPEEFRPFFLLQGALGDAFLQAHGDLFSIEFWQEMQRRQDSGEMVDFFPYPAARRLGADGGCGR